MTSTELQILEYLVSPPTFYVHYLLITARHSQISDHSYDVPTWDTR